MFSTHSLKNCPIVDPFAREPPESSLEWRSSAVGVQRGVGGGLGWSTACGVWRMRLCLSRVFGPWEAFRSAERRRRRLEGRLFGGFVDSL